MGDNGTNEREVLKISRQSNGAISVWFAKDESFQTISYVLRLASLQLDNAIIAGQKPPEVSPILTSHISKQIDRLRGKIK